MVSGITRVSWLLCYQWRKKPEYLHKALPNPKLLVTFSPDIVPNSYSQ